VSLLRTGELAVAAEPGTSARQRDALALGANRLEFLVFFVAGERLALPLGSVKEILKVSPLTPVPRAPRDVLGILSVRGRVTTVICLRTRLGLVEQTASRSARILLVDRGDEVIGMRVDAVSEVLRLQTAEIEAADVIGAGLTEHVTGIGRPAGGGPEDVVVLLDPTALLR